MTWMFKGMNLTASSPCTNSATRKVCGPRLFILRFQYEYTGLYSCRDSSTSSEVHVELGGECLDLLVIISPQYVVVNL